eukprot:PhM_4_TR12956/c0_g1_i1/m.60128/K01279/TPP1, CLN2; tripeptidyl-peptidase I
MSSKLLPAFSTPSQRLLLILLFVVIAAAEHRHVLFSHRPTCDFGKQSPINNKDYTTTLHVPLEMKHFGTSEILENELRAVSDPKSPRYGKYLSREQVRELVVAADPGKHKRHVFQVIEWLQTEGRVLESNIDLSEPDMIKVHNVAADNVIGLFPEARLIVCTETYNMRHHEHVQVDGIISIPKHLSDVIAPFITGLHGPVTKQVTESKTKQMLRKRKEKMEKKNNNNKKKLADIDIDDKIVSPKTLATMYKIPKSLYPASGISQCAVELLSSGAYEPCDLFGCPKNKTQDANLGFFNLTGLDVPGSGQDDVKVVGAFKSDQGEVESSLDIEFLITTGRGAETWYWTEARWVYDFAVAMVSADSRPDVVSISFSWSERHQCTQPTGLPNPTCTENHFDSAAYVARTNDEFKKLGLMGVTLVVSSGDDGALGNFGNCTGQQQFDPMFPAASPFVTTVGGTMLKKTSDPAKKISGADDCPDVQLKCGDYCSLDSECPLKAPCNKCIQSVWACGSGCGDPCRDFTDCLDPNCPLCDKGKCGKTDSSNKTFAGEFKTVPDWCPTAICVQNGGCATSTDEIVCTYPEVSITSGGGFSAFSAMPWYQHAAVGNYTVPSKNSTGHFPPSDWFNASNRAYPDVAAVASNYGVWMGMWMRTDGTSASTPVVAGILALVNADRVKNGKAKLGFANPLLYALRDSHPNVFRDVTEGNNACSSKCCGTVGYPAVEGWDAVTGLGTLNVDKLVEAVNEI